MPIKENIKKYRRKAKLTQIQLADKLAVSIATLRRWESGSTSPNGNMIEKMAELLGISPEDIVANKKSAVRDTDGMIVFEENGIRIVLPPSEKGYEILRELIAKNYNS